jgi:hypothetical protein
MEEKKRTKQADHFDRFSPRMMNWARSPARADSCSYEGIKLNNARGRSCELELELLRTRAREQLEREGGLAMDAMAAGRKAGEGKGIYKVVGAGREGAEWGGGRGV